MGPCTGTKEPVTWGHGVPRFSDAARTCSAWKPSLSHCSGSKTLLLGYRTGEGARDEAPFNFTDLLRVVSCVSVSWFPSVSSGPSSQLANAIKKLQKICEVKYMTLKGKALKLNLNKPLAPIFSAQ